VPDSWRHFSGGTPLFRPVSNHWTPCTIARPAPQ